VEINSHNLFSKYFSESAAFVGQMFDNIVALLADTDLFLVVLIGNPCARRSETPVTDHIPLDEVETLIPSRQAALNANDPTDGLRVRLWPEKREITF
jgi:hypothetical protein